MILNQDCTVRRQLSKCNEEKILSIGKHKLWKTENEFNNIIFYYIYTSEAT